jgi:hypothetical protein
MLGFLGLTIYRVMRWVMEAKRTPDPWGTGISEALDREDAVPICHHCLTEQEHSGWFCPHCGAIVGPYCNYMPYLYVFSQGELFRAGVTEHLRRSPLVAIGYFLASLGLFTLIAPLGWLMLPFYWIFLLSNFQRVEHREEAIPPAIS